MSNSPLVTYTLISPNKSHPRLKPIDTITIHCFVGQVTAKRGCEVFQPTSKQASANYVVGFDGSIGLCVDEGDRAWTTGGTMTVNGISGSTNDQSAVTIEVACDSFHPYAVTDAAYDALIKLVADIAKRNNMGELKWKADKSLVGKPGQQNMTVHRWFANKACPGDYLYQRMGDIAAKANEINKQKEEPGMTETEVKNIVNKAIDDAKPKTYNTVNECPEWSRDAVEWAVDSGAIKGDEAGRLHLNDTKCWAIQVFYNTRNN